MLEILFEDEWLLAVDKPAGLVVHPTYKNVGGTLLDELRAREPGAVLSVVSRLDKLTSGVVVIAKSPEVHAALQRRWPAAEKEYLAVVEGRVDPDRGEIDLPLGTDPADRRRRVVRPDGAPSRTRYERLTYIDVGASGRSVLRCWPLTGRRHQIRVHLAARGWPVAGDAVYGTPIDGFARHALHALRVSFDHPSSGARIDLTTTNPLAASSVNESCDMYFSSLFSSDR
jgi:23S rRNA pseudouridine1911/1915/1917 synthase